MATNPLALFVHSDRIDLRRCVMSKQIIKSVLCWAVAALALSVGSPVVFAQLPPALSPWLHMSDRPRNDLGNYLGAVKPQQNLMRSAASQANQLQSQQQALQNLLQATPNTGGGGATGAKNLASSTPIAPTSGATNARDVLAPPRELPRMQKNPAGFDQYLHYYPPYAMSRRPVPNFSSSGYTSTSARRR